MLISLDCAKAVVQELFKKNMTSASEVMHIHSNHNSWTIVW
jgi:hypothetical protein